MLQETVIDCCCMQTRSYVSYYNQRMCVDCSHACNCFAQLNLAISLAIQLRFQVFKHAHVALDL